MMSTEEPYCPLWGLVREQMESLQQSAAAARLPARLGQWCAAPPAPAALVTLLSSTEGFFLMPGCCSESFTGCHAQAGEAGRANSPAETAKKHKSSHCPAKTSNVLCSGTCYLLLLIYSGSLALSTGGSSPKR